MSVGIRFESRERDEDYTLEETFDWIEVDGASMVAESDDGMTRHEQLAFRVDVGAQESDSHTTAH